MNEKVVTRFAPSPTGFMHVGGVRTALFAWLWARKNGGTFILRIEDTDKEREVSGSIEHIIESLKWLGLHWDEGPEVGGLHEPYIQSKRLEIYKEYAYKLIDKGLAYSDPYTEEQLNEFREKAELEKRPFIYREHRPEILEPWDGTKPLRFKTPEIKNTFWHDLVYGDLSAGPEALDDFILIKSDGYPTYNFAHIVDDIEMGVTHVMRGQEFISSTPKFISLYKALDVEPPIFATLPPIMGPDGKKKLSKRDGAKDLLEYKKEGYLPDAFINFLAMLGWNPGDEREIFTREKLVEAFDINKIQHSGAKLNEEKLDWTNKEHLKKLLPDEVNREVLSRLPLELQNKDLVPLIMERISKWGDIEKMLNSGELDFFFKKPEFDKSKLVFKDSTAENTASNLKHAYEVLSNINESDFTKEKIKEVLMSLADNLPKRGELLHPVRFALSGMDRSPDPFIIAQILGKDETLSRLQKAI